MVEKKAVSLPLVTFLFTLDQIAGMLGMELKELQYHHIYFHAVTTGRKGRWQMVARNIAPDNDTPDWRVAQEDFVRWLNTNGFDVKWPASL